MDWIQGDKFIKLADWTYSPTVKRGDDYDNLPNTLVPAKVKDGDIVYTHTFYAKQLFEVLEEINKRVTVITHNSDVNIDFSPPSCVYKWFSQNVNVFHEKIEAIPIGLENDRWFPELRKKEKMLAKMQEPRKYKNLVYMNHNPNTNIAKRAFLYDLFKDKEWVTVDYGVNGKGFDEYIDNVYNHCFVICPEGNGLDTHRFWETLYLSAIPVVKKNINNWFYNAMPVLYVNEWSDVTEELLRDMLPMYQEGDWDREMLTFECWKNRIYGDS